MALGQLRQRRVEIFDGEADVVEAFRIEGGKDVVGRRALGARCGAHEFDLDVSVCNEGERDAVGVIPLCEGEIQLARVPVNRGVKIVGRQCDADMIVGEGVWHEVPLGLERLRISCKPLSLAITRGGVIPGSLFLGSRDPLS